MKKDDQSTVKQNISEKNNRLSGNLLGSFCTKFGYRWSSCFETDIFKPDFQETHSEIEDYESKINTMCKNKAKIMSKAKIKRLQCITDIYILLMFLVYPLIVGSQGYLNITKVKFNFFFAATLTYVALMLGIIIFSVCAEKFKSHLKLKNELKCELKCEAKYESKSETKYEPKYDIKKPYLVELLVITFLLFTTFSAILSPYGFWNIFGFGKNQGLLNIWLYGSCFLLIFRYGRPALWHIYILSISAVINCGIFFLQYVGLNPFLLYPKSYGYNDGFVEFAGNFAGLIGNVDIFAGFLSVLIALLIGLLLFKSIRWLMIQLMISVLALVLLQVSSGLLAALAVNLFLLVLIAFFFAGEKRRKGVIITISLLTAMLLTFGFVSSLGMFSDFQENFKHKVQLNLERDSVFQAESQLNSQGDSQVVPKFNSNGDSQVVSKFNSNEISSGRIYIWKNTIKALKESSAKEIAFGTGSNSFQQRTGLIFKRYDANHDKQIVSIVTSAHNLYLDILMNYGLVGLLIYLVLLSSILYLSQPFKLNRVTLIFPIEKHNLKVFSFGTTREGFTFSWMLAVLSYSIFAFFSISTFIIMPYFIIAAGLSISRMKN